MWKITHKRKNGTYVNDEASNIGVKNFVNCVRTYNMLHYELF